MVLARLEKLLVRLILKTAKIQASGVRRFDKLYDSATVGCVKAGWLENERPMDAYGIGVAGAGIY